MLPLDAPEGVDLLYAVPEDARARSWWLILRDGTPVPGDGGGGVLLMREMQSTRLVGRMMQALHLSAFIDSMDKLVAHRRGQLSRYVPDVPVIVRFP